MDLFVKTELEKEVMTEQPGRDDELIGDVGSTRHGEQRSSPGVGYCWAD